MAVAVVHVVEPLSVPNGSLFIRPILERKVVPTVVSGFKQRLWNFGDANPMQLVGTSVYLLRVTHVGVKLNLFSTTFSYSELLSECSGN